MWDHLPLIVVEVVMIFGGALAFGWWQLRDLAREKRRREERQAAAAARPPEPALAADPAPTATATAGAALVEATAARPGAASAPRTAPQDESRPHAP